MCNYPGGKKYYFCAAMKFNACSKIPIIVLQSLMQVNKIKIWKNR